MEQTTKEVIIDFLIGAISDIDKRELLLQQKQTPEELQMEISATKDFIMVALTTTVLIIAVLSSFSKNDQDTTSVNNQNIDLTLKDVHR